jgi:hypothetical protein
MLRLVSEPTAEKEMQHKTARAGFLTLSERLGWIAVIAVVLAVIAVGLAVWALLRQPAARAAPQPTSAQIADAKTHACAAFSTVTTAVSLQTHADLGADPVAAQAVGANARLAMWAGGSYLLAHLDPTTSAPLAGAIRTFATDLQDLAMNALAGVSNDEPAQAARRRDAETLRTQIADMCR